VIYLDTSALVKLIRVEPESQGLADWLDENTEMPWITSTLAEVELPRALIRAGVPEGLAAVPSILARLYIFETDAVVRSTAAAYLDPALRSLDAIHLATAQVAGSVGALTAFVSYDNRLAEAADALGMSTVAPGVN
jgi:predicted nucleic acid-binding protein